MEGLAFPDSSRRKPIRQVAVPFVPFQSIRACIKTKLIVVIKRPTNFALTEMWSRRDLYNQARPNNKTKPLQQEEEFLAVFLLQMDPSTSAKRITFIIRLGNFTNQSHLP